MTTDFDDLFDRILMIAIPGELALSCPMERPVSHLHNTAFTPDLTEDSL